MPMQTHIVKIPARGPELGRFRQVEDGASRLEEWCVGGGVGGGGEDAASSSCRESIAALSRAAAHLLDSDTPVGFPTETVYGLGADATRSAAVRGIYAAKGRPADNPLIVHVCDLRMLRGLLQGGGVVGREQEQEQEQEQGEEKATTTTLVPDRYKTLIDRFWPGPLTILLPLPSARTLAPEVTAGQPTFGARMPASPLALSLIRLAGVPLAAPSANASTRPSPTTAEHVRADLAGRIELILDGGPCRVGVESTVVDGLCDPPVVLRPGGVSLAQLRACPGWEDVVVAYSDHDGGKEEEEEEMKVEEHQGGGGGGGGKENKTKKFSPRAPGMKYKHYSPRARVVLYETTCSAAARGVIPADVELVMRAVSTTAADGNGDIVAGETTTTTTTTTATEKKMPRVGVIRTRRWKAAAGLAVRNWRAASDDAAAADSHQSASYQVFTGELVGPDGQTVTGELFDVHLGEDTEAIAQGLFSALRELDSRGTDAIFVDGIAGEMDIAAAVMNRLRKAASQLVI